MDTSNKGNKKQRQTIKLRWKLIYWLLELYILKNRILRNYFVIIIRKKNARTKTIIDAKILK